MEEARRTLPASQHSRMATRETPGRRRTGELFDVDERAAQRFVNRGDFDEGNVLSHVSG